MYIKNISNESSRIFYKRLSKLVTRSSHTVLNEETDKVDIGELVPVEASEDYDEENENPREDAEHKPLANGKEVQKVEQDEIVEKLNAAKSLIENSTAMDGNKKVDFSV